MLNSDSSIPLYLQLKQAITEEINRGTYLPGEKLPTEMELCDTYKVSRITVRKAVLDLVEEGVLIRQQGKGTYVKRPKLQRELVSVSGFSEDMVSSGNTPHNEILSYQIKAASRNISEKLNIPLGCNVLELKRMQYLEKQNLSLEITTYSLDLFPNLEDQLKQHKNISMHRILKENYDVVPAYGDKVVNVTFASAEEAELLKCTVSDPLFEIEKIAYNNEKLAIYYSLIYYHTSQVSLTITSPFHSQR